MAVAVVLVTDDNGSGRMIGDSEITKKVFFKSKFSNNVKKCQTGPGWKLVADTGRETGHLGELKGWHGPTDAAKMPSLAFSKVSQPLNLGES